MDSVEAWRQWRTWLRAVSSGDGSTVRNYSTNVLRFLSETDCKPPSEYTEEDVAEFLTQFAPRGHAKHAYAHALRSYFTWCERHLTLTVNPMEHIRLKKPRRVPPVVLSEREVAALLAAAAETVSERAAWAILLVFLLGIRRMEACGLKWDHIRETEDGPVIEIHTTKGADERAPLPLEPLAVQCLDRLRELPPTPQSTLGPEYILRVKPQTLTRWVHTAGTAAGLPAKKVGAHRLRASLATQLLKNGIDVRVVQRTLGHLRLESTAWYLEVAGEREVRAALSVVSGLAERFAPARSESIA